MNRHTLSSRLILLLSLLFAALASVIASQLRNPYLHKVHATALAGFVLAGLAAVVWGLRRDGHHRRRWLPLLWGVGQLALIAGVEGRLALQRAQVLAAPPAAVSRLSRHVVVGYTSFEEIAPLLRRVELGGIYLTARNVRGRSVADVRQEIDALQAIQRAAGRPPLWVLADQEGGKVSRLSPPLPAVAPLATLAGRSDWQQAVRTHARSTAQQLVRLGVDLDLAPVVDLKVKLERAMDLHTRLDERAIAADPKRVAEVAALWAETLHQHGVLATYKHFPGLGHVAQDTHHLTGRLGLAPRVLEARDWLPYRWVRSSATQPAVMIAHLVLSKVDARTLASSSRTVIDGVLRKQLGHRGLVLTDDLCMSPVIYSDGGIAARAAEGLRAGVDLLLVTFAPEQVYPLLAGLLDGERSGRPAARVSEAALAASRARLAAARRSLEAAQR